MSDWLVIISSSSTLMHTSLAYFSNEIRTLDAIISYSSRSILPREILLLIRAYLLTNVTNGLMVQSYSALQRYENTLRRLLCTECLSYNEFVYGDDLWQWKDFSGACRCIEAVYLASRPPYTNTSSSSLNPKRFMGRRQWLEHYLSRKSLRFIPRTHLDQSIPSIWCLVRRVLQQFQCVSIHDISPPLCSNERGDILIVPVPGVRPLAGTDMLPDERTTKLERVERDLGLTVPRSTPLSQMSMSPVKFSPPLEPFAYHPAKLSSRLFRASANLIPALCIVVIPAVSLPVSFLTLVLALVCYYYKPRAFTILL